MVKALTQSHTLVLFDAALLHNFNVWTYMTATHTKFLCPWHRLERNHPSIYYIYGIYGNHKKEMYNIIQNRIMIHFKVN